MSRDSILMIRETEQKAAELIEQARAQAREMILHAEEDGRRLCAEAEAATRSELATVKETLHERTAQTVAHADEEAHKEAEEIRKGAFLNKRSAEKIVIRGLMSKCR